MKRNASLKSHAIGQRKRPGPVEAGRRPNADSKDRRVSPPKDTQSTPRIIRRFLESAAALEVVRASRIRERLRALRAQHRNSIERLDAMAGELAALNREALE